MSRAARWNAPSITDHAVHRRIGPVAACAALAAVSAPFAAMGALPTGAVWVNEPMSMAYCTSLRPSSGREDLRAEAAEFARVECGKYTVSCSDVDDMTFFAAKVAPLGSPRGTILSFSGGLGNSFHTENVQEYVDAGFQVFMIAYDALLASAPVDDADQRGGRLNGLLEPRERELNPWSCARAGCPGYVDVSDPGPKQAACRPATIIRYFKEVSGDARQLPYCAQGHSAGSSQLAYALAHYGAEAYLDYVQMTAWTPFARPDLGCDPHRAGEQQGRRNYWGTNPDGVVQEVDDRPFDYDATGPLAHVFMDLSFGLPARECGAHPTAGVSDASFARLQEQGIVSTGADYTYPRTVIDAYACSSTASMVDGNGSWFFELIRDQNRGRVFMRTLRPGAGGQQCTGEEVWWKADGTTPSALRQLTIDRMIDQCSVRY
jgi:hypothetical protein